MQRLRALVNSSGEKIGRPRQGYFLQPCTDLREGEPRHALGHELAGLTCVNGGCLMVSLLRLDVADRRLEMEMLPVAKLPLIACPEHFRTVFQYSFTSAGECLAGESDRHGSVLAPLGSSLVGVEPQPVLLHAIPDRVTTTRRLAREGRLAEADGWARRFYWEDPQHQVGGVPLRLNKTLGNPSCSLCGKPMPFLASVVVDVQNELGEEGGFGQMLYFLCRRCACVCVIPDFEIVGYS